MSLFILGWYAVGFSGAWAASMAMLHLHARYEQPAEFTRGHLLATAIWGALGPITWIAAAIWWACELGDSHGNAKGFWSKPLFRSRDGK